MNENIILIDQEQPENAFAIGYFALGLIFRPAGKETVPLVPPGSEAAAQLLEAGLYPCDDRNLSDFPFYPVPSSTLFGEDEYGTVYGLVGGCDDDAPVGYVTVAGETGTAAGNIGAFMRLLSQPGWPKKILAQKMPSSFVIYPSRTEAEKEWKFADQPI